MNSVAALLSEPGDLKQTLTQITLSAKHNIPGADYVSISFRDAGGQLETLASTDAVPQQLDSMQYELSEGPCFDAVTDGNVTYSGNLAHDPRWPEFGPRAAAVGVRSQMAIRLHADLKTRTGLNFYSRQLSAFDQPDELIALFASHARIALGFAKEVDNLQAAVTTRKLIGEAIGIIRERYQMSEDRAFEFLVRVSQTSNIKLRLVAEEIVNLPAGTEPLSGTGNATSAGRRTG
jgi:ANTAR domain-containing protein/GAF domain-containing protein